ncbi:MAG: NUDIX domain-containing protein [Candidatus Nanoarchaeia archaeon]|nr:NUDIX domain-containing protein [Candidatus Nanoarchaeia archaeon]
MDDSIRRILAITSSNSPESPIDNSKKQEIQLTELSIKEKAHYVSVTGIIKKGGKYLICKRSANEKAFPGKWCVPGGKIEMKDFVNSKKDTADHWLGVFERVLEKEIMEETGLRIKNIGYVSNLAFIRPNGFSTIIVSLFAEHDSGEVNLSEEELVDYRWVSLEEAKRYDLIENIYEQIEKVDKMPSASKRL